MSDIIASSTS